MASELDSRVQFLIKFGLVLWVSFLFAGVASTFFFATFDPPQIAQVATFPMDLTRSAGYTIGFLLFWVLLVCNSIVVLWLSARDSKPTSQK